MLSMLMIPDDLLPQAGMIQEAGNSDEAERAYFYILRRGGKGQEKSLAKKETLESEWYVE